MRTVEQILALAQSRRMAQSPLTQRMADVAAHYHDDVALPLPELDENEKYSVPNLIAQGIDQFAMRVASVLPDMTWPALSPDKPRSVQRAADRRQVAFAWWESSGMRYQIRQRARWLIAYGSGPSLVCWDTRNAVPSYVSRNPMLTLAADKANPWEFGVEDCIFVHRWTHAMLTERYGIGYAKPNRNATSWTDCGPDEPVELTEYLDGDQWTLVCTGPDSAVVVDRPYSSRREAGISAVTIHGRIAAGKGEVCELDTVYHDLGVCPVSIPSRFGLERVTGQMDAMLGLRGLQARLMALEVLSVERSIFPNEWAILDGTGNSQVVKLADGRSGVVGEIRGGTMHVTNLQPGMLTNNTIDRLERAQRQNGLLPAEFGGEAASTVRTGRRGDQILSATVDASIREHHDLIAGSLEYENTLAVAWAKRYRRGVTVYVGKEQSQLDYTASELFETDRNSVDYAMAGADVSQLIVNTAQLMGTELISADTARRMNPLIDDAEHERGQVIREQIDRAVLSGFQQAAASGQLSLDDAAYVQRLVTKDHLDLVDAIEKAQQRAQARQASAGPPGTPEGPVQPGAPEAQPGLAAGTPAEAGATQPAIEPPSESQVNMAGLLRALQTTKRAANSGAR